MTKPVGIIGSGSFGIALCKLLEDNNNVLIYSRRQEIVDSINQRHEHIGVKLSGKVVATNDPKFLCDSCTLIFPVVSSNGFRDMIKGFAPFLTPSHILIHGTKGLDLVDLTEEELRNNVVVSRASIRTMSEVIVEETSVLRVGCLSGPNLASELIAGQPSATVIASKFDEVFELGKKALQSNRFHVFGSYEILGAEFSGAFKNIIALGTGILDGKGLGKNIQAMLITRGLTEMIQLGTRLGATNKAFLGTAGIGDLIATATSTKSRNYSYGVRLAQGESIESINGSLKEVAEGVRTLKIAHRISRTYKLHVPIVDMLHRVVFEGYEIDKAMKYLMEYPHYVDVDFL
jgi:glycerol-3-phosphate dehydrogenase (NAD(P)+)